MVNAEVAQNSHEGETESRSQAADLEKETVCGEDSIPVGQAGPQKQSEGDQQESPRECEEAQPSDLSSNRVGSTPLDAEKTQ